MKIKRIFFLLLIVLFFISIPLTGQEKAEWEIPEAFLTDWKVGICALEGAGSLEAGNTYLTNSIPLLIYTSLKECKDHNLTEREKEGYRIKTRRELVKNEKNTLLGLLNERDRILFETAEADFNITYEAKNIAIDDKIKYISFLENLDVDEMPIKDTTPIVLKTGGEATLHFPGAEEPLDYMKNQGLDFLVCGNIEEIEEYFFIEMVCYSMVEQKAVAVLEDAGSLIELTGIIDRLTKELYTLLLGREWAGIKVTTTQTASVYINGVLSGIGNAQEVLLHPGEVWVDINSTEHKNISFPVDLEAGEITKVNIDLEQLERDYFHIDTNPPGADVYIGAIWQGKTPIEIFKPLLISELMIKRDGYLPYHKIVDPDTMKKTLNVTLEFDRRNGENPLEMRQDEFYNSLGWMALSIGATFVMFGIEKEISNQINYYNALIAANRFPSVEDKYAHRVYVEHLKVMQLGFQIGGFACLGATGGTIVLAKFKLDDYINEAERFIED